MLLSGKKIFITAAGQGIGRAITEKFIKEKGSVLATDINYELIKGIRSEKKQLDVLDKYDLQKTISNLMGNKPELRFEFIREKANLSNNLVS